ncbi:U-box domain-containing protein 45 [Ancistrocladus abbreviatus]
MCKILSNMYCKVMNIFPALEATRPRSRSGIQALCSLHVALEKAKNILQHCSECSKLYLAITGDSVLLKFEKAKCGLADNLRRVEDIVPQSIGCQVQEIVCELDGAVFSLDSLEKQVGDDIVALLQQGRKFEESCNDNSELESFHQAASKLGINSSRAALAERRALKKLIERARMEEDKRKESIVAYLLHLMRKYSKLFRTDLTDDNDSQGSTPCSPTVQGSFEDGNGHRNTKAFDGQFSKINSFNFQPSFSFRPNDRRSGHMPIPPEELRCPISLQLMYDPVIIASGQTYERVCIEKWFNDGHNTCPKTQQQLPHLCLTPNYCVKGLITSWCEQHGIPVPDGPPESLDLNYWRLALSDTESAKSRSLDGSNTGKLKGVKVVPLEESDATEDTAGNEVESGSVEEDVSGISVFERYEKFLAVLGSEEDLRKKCRVVEQIRQLLRHDEEARMFMGAHGFVEALVQFLKSALDEGNFEAQEVGAMALFNLGVNNNRNKELMLAAGIISLLEEMMSDPDSHGLAAALYLNLSCLEEAKPIIGSRGAVPFLVKLLLSEADPQSKLDSLHAIFNLSTFPANIPYLLQSGVINGLHLLLTESHSNAWTEKSIAVLLNLGSTIAGKDTIVAAPGLVTELATILDNGEPIEQEQAASCLLILCNGNEQCSQMVLQEGVIPSLVSISVNGTARGRDKAQKLLMLFREQRQRDPATQPQPVHQPPLPISEKEMQPPPPKPLSKSVTLDTGKMTPDPEPNSLIKSFSRRKLGKTFTLFRKSRTYSEHH